MQFEHTLLNQPHWIQISILCYLYKVLKISMQSNSNVEYVESFYRRGGLYTWFNYTFCNEKSSFFCCLIHLKHLKKRLITVFPYLICELQVLTTNCTLPNCTVEPWSNRFSISTNRRHQGVLSNDLIKVGSNNS